MQALGFKNMLEVEVPKGLGNLLVKSQPENYWFISGIFCGI